MAEKKMQRIKVVITEREIHRWPNQHILTEFNKVKKLKEAGVPIAGTNTLDCVFSGKLTIWREFDLNEELEFHYEWVGPVVAPPADDDEL